MMEEGKTLIVGLGKTGLSCARYLAACGIPAAVIDSRENPPGLEQLRRELPDTALFLGGFDARVFAAAERLVVSPGVSVAEPMIQHALKRGVPIIGDIELFSLAADAPVAAITGSNGKSTVTTLLGRMAKDAGRRVAVGGNLGEPALDLLGRDADLYILELSSFQLETTESLRPAAAVVLNVSPDHMDRYHSLAEYAAAKSKLYRHAGGCVYNLDDPQVMAMRESGGAVRYFTLGKPAADCYGLNEWQGEEWIFRSEQPLLAVRELPMAGRHNVANALAALAMGELLELRVDSMLQTLREFHGLPHRTQFVRELNGVRWYNDSKGTNVGASIAALEGLNSQADGRIVLIAGGDGKGADFTPMAQVVANTARAVVLIGRDSDRIALALNNLVQIVRAASLEEAVEAAARLACPGDSVLLSPACASFDMFRDYQHRGEVFMDAVGRLAG